MLDVKPTIPVTEYPERWRRVQALMDEQGLDIVVAYADDRAVFGPAHVRWLANLPIHFEPACILVPHRGGPILLCGPESEQYALLTGQIRDVRVLREFTHPDEDYPYSAIQGLAEVVAQVVPDLAAVRRIGLAGRGLMGADLLAALLQAMPGVEWVDVEGPMCGLRARKSAAEIDVIRYAYHIAEAGMQAAMQAVRVGVTEREVSAEAEAAMRRAGAEGTGIDTIVASGPNSRPILARSTFRRIQANELVCLTVAPRYEGYHGAIGRPVLVGEPGMEITQAVELACRAQEACVQAMCPGVDGRAVEAAGRRMVEAAGLGRHFLYSGVHSTGVIEFEPPIFGPGSVGAIAPDMVLSVDIPLFDAPWGGLRVEDGFLVTALGVERLDNTPHRVQKDA